MSNAEIDRIAEISFNIRRAVVAALPTPPEQFLTLMAPGKVVDFENYQVDKNAIVLPTEVELNQAILCDDMPVLSTLQLGPTGRSVARSYAATISKLVPAVTPIGIVDGSQMTEGQKRYDQAMKILSAEVPDMPGKSIVELYAEKQSKYTNAVSEKTKAFNSELELSQRLHPNNPKLARETYDKWVGENARIYRNNVQAAYMEWVVTGKKEEVEYWFSVVDQDSALARVEQSKEAMRWAVVQDVDGSCEYQKVKLEPADWANQCLEKMNSKDKQTVTPEWYTWEINRLEKMNVMLATLKKNPPLYPVLDGGLDKEWIAAETNLKEAMQNHMKAGHAYRLALAGLEEKKVEGKAEGKAKGGDEGGDEGEAEGGAKMQDEDPEAKKAKIKETLEAFEAARDKLQEKQTAFDKVNIQKLSYEHKITQNSLLSKVRDDGKFVDNLLESNNAKIKEHQNDRKKLLVVPDADALDIYAKEMNITPSDPKPPKSSSPDAKTKTNFFTPITVEVTSSSDKQHNEAEELSFSAGASASWGIAKLSASVSHSEAHSKAMQELTESSIKISFECMRVDISRSWLRPELFYEDELVPGPNVRQVFASLLHHISPGFSRLNQLLDGRNKGPDFEKDRQRYSTFAYYPTAFLVACNVVLEISGSTSSLEDYMNSSNTSGSASFSYGPFASGNVSGSKSTSDAGHSCTSTASGCRIEIKSPQIIAWVSQMVPALPRI